MAVKSKNRPQRVVSVTKEQKPVTEEITAVAEQPAPEAPAAEPAVDQPVAEVQAEPAAEAPAAEAPAAEQPAEPSLAELVAQEGDAPPAEAPAEEPKSVAAPWIDAAIQAAKDTAPGGMIFERNPNAKTTKSGAAKACELLCNRIRNEFPEGISSDQLAKALEVSLPVFAGMGNREGLQAFMKFVTQQIAGGRGHFMRKTGRVAAPVPEEAEEKTPEAETAA